MSYRKINVWNSVDWWTIALYLILVIAGWFSIYASTYDYNQEKIWDIMGTDSSEGIRRSGMQMIWIITSLVIGFVILMIESDWYEIFSYWIYILIIALLILTILIAPDIKGSRSWLVLGPVRLQPAEFAKFATALVIAKAMSAYRFELLNLTSFVKILGLFCLPAVLILLQKETGSALVFLAFFVVLYREGMSGFVLFLGFCAILFFVIVIRLGILVWHSTPVGEYIVLLLIIGILLGLLYNYKKGRNHLKVLVPVSAGILILSVALSYYLPFSLSWVALGIIGLLIGYFFFLYVKYRAFRYVLIILFAIGSSGFLYSVDYVFNKVMEPHQRIRIEVALGVIDDPSGAGYNVNQSKIAIGSGGVLGKGYLNGTQTKLKYVPEQDTDFIFCTIGEEKGFVGSCVILLLFLVLIIRMVVLAERQKTTFSRIYGYGVTAILFFHVAINIGMVIGITPVIGIPLPFFSYGGSSLWAFTILVFIFLRLDAARNDRL
jgi:rod shape determining protein RodA